LKKQAEARAAELRRSAAVRLRKQAESAPSAVASMNQQVVAAGANAQESGAIETASDIAEAAIEIRERDRVIIKSLGREGTVESISDGQYTVIIGSLRFRARRDELKLVKTAAQPSSKQIASLPRGVSADVKVDLNFTPEINVIGATADEATERVDKFLDEAAMAGADSVRIVHGHGKGVLRKAITDLLKGHPHVERFHQAPANEGGAGATVAVLRK
jgi:DNA mismatch repair protein MutS2